MAGPKGDGKILSQVDGCSFGDRVRECRVVACGADGDAGDGGCDDDAGGVLYRASGFEEGGKSGGGNSRVSSGGARDPFEKGGEEGRCNLKVDVDEEILAEGLLLYAYFCTV